MGRLRYFGLLWVFFLIAVTNTINVYSQLEKSLKLDSIFQEYARENYPGMNILVQKEGEVLFSKSYGLADIQKKEEFTQHSKINLGAITRQFTAAGIMILKDRDKLTLEQSVGDILDMPDYASDITINHLLLQVSGLPFSFHDVTNITNEELLDFLHEKNQLSFKPNTRAQHNPANYALLALIIEKISGKDYRKFMEDNVFKPLRMNHTEVFKDGWFSGVKNRATGYIFNSEENDFDISEKELGNDYLRGVTGVFSDMNDLKKWLSVWKSDVLLSESSLKIAKRIKFFRNAKFFYGFGWRRGFNAGHNYLFAGGSDMGYTSFIFMHPSENFELIILHNQTSIFGLHRNAFEILNLYSDKQYEVK